MSSPNNGKPPPDFSDSDLRWYACLSGAPLADPGPPAEREALAMRMALEQRRHEVGASPDLVAAISDEAMQLQLQALRQRIQRDGVFERAPPAAATLPPAPAAPNVIEFPWWRRRGGFLAMAASVLVAVVLVQQITSQPDYAQPPVMSGADGTQQMRVAQPKQAAEQWAAQLRQAGLRPGLYQRGTTYVVDINLMAADLPAATPAFATLQRAPAVGFNRIEFNAR